MALFIWKDDYSVKIEKIDEQHKKLVNLLNELHSSMLAAKATSVLEKTLDELVQYAAVHFKTEEDLMRSYDFSQYNDHKNAHNNFTEKVGEFYKDYKDGKKMISVELLFFLKDWLINHINGVDK
ncbi:MAG TPA: bacteriohemerythrin, partial [Spirochaetota bacterium]|nr:bacteriohemerythrin [Spirochaetota bacterium]